MISENFNKLVQISEDLELQCQDYRDKLNQLEKEIEAIGGGFMNAQANDKFNVQTNVLHHVQNYQGKKNGQEVKQNRLMDDDMDFGSENIENFLPD